MPSQKQAKGQRKGQEQKSGSWGKSNRFLGEESALYQQFGEF